MIKLNLKKALIALIISLTAVPATIADENVNCYGSDPKISDLALIYAGASRRPKWDKSQLRPYVTHTYADGHEDWFFDGFLFLEFDNGTVAFGNGSGKAPAMQSDWQWLLDEYFTKGYKLHALDELIEEKKQTLGEPPLRHKVVITCCAPTKLAGGSWSRRPWGKVDGKDVIFMSQSGRVKAVQWYIDTLIDLWNKVGFKNIDLEGIYWIEEGLYSNGEIMAEINDYVHSKGLRSYWIPYYTNNQAYWSKWKDEYNFDMCYIQPNYAFYNNDGSTKPFSLLTETVDAAKSYGMGLELEFETQERSNALHSVNPVLHQHINDYMDVFDEKGVFDQAGVAYYTGTQGLIHMDQSSDPVDHATIDRMARYVAARQKARAENAGMSDPEVVDSVLAYTSGRRIYMNPDTCCHDIAGRLIHSGEGVVDCNPGVYIVNDKRGNSVKLMVK